MKATVRVTKSFKKQAKPLLKKYPSLKQELFQLERTLVLNPQSGIPLGNNCFKIRLAIKSKRKGKSGGLRAISHLESEVVGLVENEDEIIVITLISIYDKSDTASITDKELRELISRL